MCYNIMDNDFLPASEVVVGSEVVSDISVGQT